MTGRRTAVAQTAFGPMVIAACEQHTPPARRLVDDPLAARLLPAGQRLLVRAGRWPAVQQRLAGATERLAVGMWASMLCRKRYGDDQVAAALEAGIGQLVVLGAGLDTRAHRLAAPAGVPAFEVDLPANIASSSDGCATRWVTIPVPCGWRRWTSGPTTWQLSCCAAGTATTCW